MSSQIGIDSLKLYLPQFRLKSDTKVNINKSVNLSEANKYQTVFEDTGEEIVYSDLRLRGVEDIQVEFKASGALTAKVSVPKVHNRGRGNIELYDCQANKEAVQYIFDSLTDSGVAFDSDYARVSRLDITRNLELKNQVPTYFSMISMLPKVDKRYQLDTTTFQGNKSFALCCYDKIKEAKDKSEYIPEGYLNKNLMRVEARLLKATKLRTDSRRAGIELRDIDSIINPDKFLKVQNLYLSYMAELFRYDYKQLTEQEKNRLISQLITAKKAGFTDLRALAITNGLFAFCSVDEIALVLHPKEEALSRQKRYRFKKSFDRWLSRLDRPDLRQLLDEDYQELRTEALRKVA